MATSATRQWESLERANAIRIERSRLLGGNPRGGRTSGTISAERAAELIMAPPEALMTARIGLLLRRCRYVGPRKVASFCEAVGASETRLIRELTERQRRLLAEQLRALKRNSDG